MGLLGIIVTILVIWNTIVCIIYGIDKRKSIRGAWRISESTLLLLAAFMGGAGALFGMYFFRHKTRRLKFQLGVPMLLLLNIVIGVAAIFLFLQK